MRLHRFYIEQPLGEELVVENRELLHQWITVFRYTSGDGVILFSAHNKGEDHTYILQTISKQGVILKRVSVTNNIIPSKSATLYMAVVKKDTFEGVVRQATELGVTRITPILAARSEKKNLNMDRLVAIATEAAEQCGRGDIPTVSPIVSFNEALKQADKEYNVLLSLHGKDVKTLQELEIRSINPCAVWIGPEGGWTSEEEALCIKQGFSQLKLTDTVLKADTAALAALATLLLA
jgi:16S rRNA (uracil1498-N3)-methyltransferase